MTLAQATWVAAALLAVIFAVLAANPGPNTTVPVPFGTLEPVH